MISAKILLLSSMSLLVAACSTTSPPPDAPNVTTVRAADPESQRRFREALLEEQREREAAERATAEQQALREREAAERALAEQEALRERENRLASEVEAQARIEVAPEAEAQRQEALLEYRRRNDEEETSRSASSSLGNDEAGTSSSPNLRNAQDVERAEARVAELREQIAAYKAETANLESTNAALREAIAAAEDLSKILAAEQEKYNSTDPAAAQTANGLAKARIEELKAQLERLRAQAAALSQPAQ